MKWPLLHKSKPIICICTYTFFMFFIEKLCCLSLYSAHVSPWNRNLGAIIISWADAGLLFFFNIVEFENNSIYCGVYKLLVNEFVENATINLYFGITTKNRHLYTIFVCIFQPENGCLSKKRNQCHRHLRLRKSKTVLEFLKSGWRQESWKLLSNWIKIASMQ